MTTLDKLFGIGVILSLHNQLSPVAKQARKDLRELQGQVDDLDKRIERFDAFQKWANRGAGMTKVLTLPLVGAAVAAMKMQVDWESAFTGVRKTVDATEEEFAALETGIFDMAKRIPMLPTELAKITESAGQLGIRGVGNLLKFTEVIAKLGVSTNLSAEQGATQLARFANITGMAMEDIDRLGSTVVVLGNNLATTEAEITDMGMRLAGAGKQVGMSEHQILAMAGALTSLGINAEAGGTAMSKLMSDLANTVATGGDELKLFAAVAGQSVEEFSKAYRQDAGSAILSFVKGLDRISDQGGNVFAVLEELGIQEMRMRDAVLRLANGHEILEQAMGLAAKGWEENTALSREAALRFSTAESQLQLTRNQLWLLAQEFGKALMPVLRFVNLGLINVLEVVRELPQPVKLGIIAIGGLVAAAGPLLWIFGTLASSIVHIQTLMAVNPKFTFRMVNSLHKLKTVALLAFGGIKTGALALAGIFKIASLGMISAMKSAAVFMATNPIGIALLALAGAVTAFTFAWKNNWFGIRDTISGITESIKQYYAEEGIMGFVKLLNPLGFFSEAWERNWFGIRDVTAKVTNWLGEKLNSIRNTLQSLSDWLTNSTLVKWLSTLGETIGGLWDRITGKLETEKMPAIGLSFGQPQLAIAGATTGSTTTVTPEYQPPQELFRQQVVPNEWNLPMPTVPVVNKQEVDQIYVTVQATQGITQATADVIGRDIARAIKREKEGRPR